MKEQGTDGEKIVTLGEVLNLATPRGATIVSPERENFDFDEPLYIARKWICGNCVPQDAE